MTEEGKYQYGFGNVFSTEAIPDTLPKGQNNPQRCPFNLYAEQLSGTAFTVERSRNMFTWMYRIRPSVCHGPFMPQDSVLGSSDRMVITPNQLRWNPFSIQTSALQHNFIDGLKKICSSGNPSEKAGLSISVYRAGKSMSPDKRVMMNSDGDLLIVPQQGTLQIRTELGRLSVEPNEIVVIPRGIKFSVDLSSEEPIRGYVLEIYKGHFELPSLGAIGANGLANRRDFLYPVASFEDSDEPHLLVNKFMDNLFEAHIDHSPFDVVAWSGNYSPYKYDLRKFCVINTVSFDHPDPSIFTVLTCPSEDPGTATADFVIFPPRYGTYLSKRYIYL
jgi:homogentisate 1,2-dioxygenase